MTFHGEVFLLHDGGTSEIGNLDALAAKYPSVAADLRAIAASVRHVPPSGQGPR